MGIYIAWDKKSVQTLSTILLPIIIAAVGSSFYQLVGIWKSLREIQGEVEILEFQNYKFQLEGDKIIILEQVIERLETRTNDMFVIHDEIVNEIKQSDIEELELKIFQNQLASVEDYGKLQQLDSDNYVFLPKAARLLSEVLKKEQTVWLTLQKLLRASENNKSIDLENTKTEFSEELTNYVLTMRTVKSQFPGLKDEVGVMNQKLTMEDDRLKIKLQILSDYKRLYTTICVVGLIIGLILAVVILGLQVGKTKP